MRKRLAIGLVCLGALGALAADGLSLDAITGVYRNRHRVVIYGDPKVESAEDILEVVKVSPREAYIRTSLIFDNGHVCSLHGVASVEGAALVYRHRVTVFSRGRSTPGTCALSLSVSGGQIVFHDPQDRCKWDSCGMRGRYEGRRFDLKSRRAIRYMPRLLASEEYAEAMKERNARH